MTLPPHKIGDKGQRYVYRVSGWPTDEESNVIYAETIDDAEKVIGTLCRCPGATRVTLYDRTEGRNVITRFAGMLR